MFGYISVCHQLAKSNQIGVEFDDTLVFGELPQELLMFLLSIDIAKLMWKWCEIDIVTIAKGGGIPENFVID